MALNTIDVAADPHLLYVIYDDVSLDLIVTVRCVTYLYPYATYVFPMISVTDFDHFAAAANRGMHYQQFLHGKRPRMRMPLRL